MTLASIMAAAALVAGCAFAGKAERRAEIGRADGAEKTGLPDPFGYGPQRARIIELAERERDPVERARLLMELADLAKRTRGMAISSMNALEGRADPASRSERQVLDRLAKAMLDEELKRLDLLVRDHPDFHRCDEALYRLGATLLERDHPDEALAYIRALLADHPTSPYAARGYLAFADHFFERDDLDQAIKLYGKAIALGNPEATATAHHKLGLCRLNRGESDGALESFAEAARGAAALGGPIGQALREEALADLVRAYVGAGEVMKAEEFFEKIGADRVDELLGSLGQAYFDAGRFEDSIAVNRRVAKMAECSALQARAHVLVFEARLFLGALDDLKAEAQALVEVYARLAKCVAPEDMAEFAEVGAVAKETLKREAERFRAEYEMSSEPAAIQMADDLEALAESF